MRTGRCRKSSKNWARVCFSFVKEIYIKKKKFTFVKMSPLIPGRGLLITHQWRRHQFKSASQILLNNPFPPYFPGPVCMLSRVLSDSLQPYRLLPTSLLCLWDSPGKSPEMDCHALLQGIFPNPGIKPLSALQADSLLLSHHESPTSCSPSPYKPKKKPFFLCLNLRH